MNWKRYAMTSIVLAMCSAVQAQQHRGQSGHNAAAPHHSGGVQPGHPQARHPVSPEEHMWNQWYQEQMMMNELDGRVTRAAGQLTCTGALRAVSIIAGGPESSGANATSGKSRIRESRSRKERREPCGGREEKCEQAGSREPETSVADRKECIENPCWFRPEHHFALAHNAHETRGGRS